ncbi:hypothetical protein LBMAG42_02340 [Deltaproteobacteria bacterium]|nr:hypothetical protein LBMAG42_02340 [Deltaproteobacteria bacterium]
MLLMLLFAGCDTESMSQSWQIDRLRVLAVAAEPAEPRPGDVVTFDALVVSPAEPLGGSAWFVCDAGSSTDFGCEIDSGLIAEGDIGTVDAEALAAAGFIGFLPGLTPTWAVPADYLDELAEEEKLEGTFAMTYVTAFPEVAEGEQLDEDAVEIAFKRVPVSLAATPNHNPVILGWRVDGLDIAPGALVDLDPGEPFTLEVVLADDAVETYSFRKSDGVDETREEEPYFSWYLQEGEFSQANTLWPFTETVYFAPAEPALPEQSLWVVVRDRRGGMAWASLAIRFI